MYGKSIRKRVLCNTCLDRNMMHIIRVDKNKNILSAKCLNCGDFKTSFEIKKIKL